MLFQEEIDGNDSVSVQLARRRTPNSDFIRQEIAVYLARHGGFRVVTFDSSLHMRRLNCQCGLLSLGSDFLEAVPFRTCMAMV